MEEQAIKMNVLLMKFGFALYSLGWVVALVSIFEKKRQTIFPEIATSFENNILLKWLSAFQDGQEEWNIFLLASTLVREAT